jgi:alkanesulfonate monooxygenase SsuD/methylene tetrahydromethanopterin reductase-like flavin-dependent oxidoreductase (luciferase family)
MKLGLHIPAMSWAGGTPRLGSTLADICEAAEAAGFDTIDVADHLWQHPTMGGPTESQLEAYTTLGFIAAHTKRVRLFTLATAVSFRPAGLLAKAVTTLDVLSGGRAMLGIGAGDYPEEAAGLGLRFPPLGERFDLLEETVQACLAMWTGERGDERPWNAERVPDDRRARQVRSSTLTLAPVPGRVDSSRTPELAGPSGTRGLAVLVGSERSQPRRGSRHRGCAARVRPRPG